LALKHVDTIFQRVFGKDTYPKDGRDCPRMRRSSANAADYTLIDVKALSPDRGVAGLG